MGGGVVHLRLAVGCKRDGDAILQHEHRTGTVRVEPADPNVRPEPRAFLVLNVYARDRAQDLVRAHRLHRRERARVDRRRRSGDPRKGVARRTNDRDRGKLARPGGEAEVDTQRVSGRHAEHRGLERVLRRARLNEVSADRDVAEDERSGRVRQRRHRGSLDPQNGTGHRRAAVGCGDLPQENTLCPQGARREWPGPNDQQEPEQPKQRNTCHGVERVRMDGPLNAVHFESSAKH